MQLGQRAVQHLLRQAACQCLEHGIDIIAAREQLARPCEFGRAPFVGLRLQVADQLDHATARRLDGSEFPVEITLSRVDMAEGGGVLNAALIAGNPPEQRVEKLRAFWEAVTAPPLGIPYMPGLTIQNDMQHQIVNQWRAMGTMLWGAPSFFKPRIPPPLFTPTGNPGNLSYYDIAPLKALLEQLVDFERINTSETRFSVGATNVKTGNFAYFDNKTHKVGAAHVMASGSLPPGFPATEVDGEFYWDGGIVSNTPLDYVQDVEKNEDLLIFQVIGPLVEHV